MESFQNRRFRLSKLNSREANEAKKIIISLEMTRQIILTHMLLTALKFSAFFISEVKKVGSLN